MLNFGQSRRALFAGALLAVFSGCGESELENAKSVTDPGRERSLKEIPNDELRTFLKGYPGDWRSDTDQSKGIAAPSSKAIPEDAELIRLTAPDQWELKGATVRDALASRRSRRTFSDEPLSVDELSFLLWSAQGITATGEDETGGTHEFRTAPSGGGRYPLETYVAIHRAEEIEAGVYRYIPDEHAIVLIQKTPDIATKTAATCYGQDFVGNAAAVFMWTATPYRTEWRYAYLSHRMIAMEAGHVCQNLYLAAEAIGAGACALLSYHQPAADKLVGVDGKDEFVIYIACVGKRAD